VKLWKEFWANPYKFVWMRIGGRPWTHISRDIYHKCEYIVLTGLFTGGYFLGSSGLLSWKWFLVLMAVYTIGFIHGHFFWGTKYIEGQDGRTSSSSSASH